MATTDAPTAVVSPTPLDPAAIISPDDIETQSIDPPVPSPKSSLSSTASSDDPFPTRDAAGVIIYATTNGATTKTLNERKCSPLHNLCCVGRLASYYIGNMPVLLARNGEPVLVMGAWWPFCGLVTLPLIVGSVVLVSVEREGGQGGELLGVDGRINARTSQARRTSV